MAQGNFKDCLAVTLKYEGGFVNHPRDPGGATNKGVTLKTFRRYRPNATVVDLRSISDSDVQRIYRDGYWNKVSAEYLPHGVDLAVFDFGVNSGPSRAARHLQAAVGAAQDGNVGPQTRKAAREPRGDDLVRKLCARRLSFVRGLSTWEVFGRGWSRRITDVEARGVAMWLAVNATAAGTKMALEEHAAGAGRKASAQSKGAAASGGAGVAGGAADVSMDPSVLLVGAVLLAVAGVALFIKGRQNKDRALAYRRAADEVAV